MRRRAERLRAVVEVAAQVVEEIRGIDPETGDQVRAPAAQERQAEQVEAGERRRRHRRASTRPRPIERVRGRATGTSVGTRSPRSPSRSARRSSSVGGLAEPRSAPARSADRPRRRTRGRRRTRRCDRAGGPASGRRSCTRFASEPEHWPSVPRDRHQATHDLHAGPRRALRSRSRRSSLPTSCTDAWRRARSMSSTSS